MMTEHIFSIYWACLSMWTIYCCIKMSTAPDFSGTSKYYVRFLFGMLGFLGVFAVAVVISETIMRICGVVI